ncbi:hypothetical protein N431DRAFT_437797 [Stipitochalara longipes BDJ]|nr:hypothetical protein N431DRAFT_437797 [Stipitochalara longipes BDJ]
MPQFTTPSTRWAALQSRNPKAASAFVYCVTTTKIYCRPTCPSRLARRANIMFHDTASEAEAEGFRACKRCRPELRDGEGDPQKIAVEKACGLVRKEQRGGEDGKWTVKALATEVGLTESHFCRIFKKIMGMTVGEYRASILPESTGKLSEGSATEQQGLDFARGQDECFPTPDIPRDYGYENRVLSENLDCPELANDWNRFSGVISNLSNSVSPHMDLDFIDHEYPSSKHLSDAINIDMMDDGFQFLDFDAG